MKKYRKKPVVVEAVWYTGSRECFDKIWDWMGGDEADINQGYGGTDSDPREFGIKTPEGRMTCFPGDWVIKGIKGEFYPCKSDIFSATYESVDDDED